jgi:hypothetical protein
MPSTCFSTTAEALGSIARQCRHRVGLRRVKYFGQWDNRTRAGCAGDNLSSIIDPGSKLRPTTLDQLESPIHHEDAPSRDVPSRRAGVKNGKADLDARLARAVAAVRRSTRAGNDHAHARRALRVRCRANGIGRDTRVHRVCLVGPSVLRRACCRSPARVVRKAASRPKSEVCAASAVLRGERATAPQLSMTR